MQKAVSQNLQGAMRGGAPGSFQWIRSFVSIQEQIGELCFDDGQVDGLPVWTLIYYCLRCGEYKAAYHCVQQAGLAEPSFIPK